MTARPDETSLRDGTREHDRLTVVVDGVELSAAADDAPHAGTAAPATVEDVAEPSRRSLVELLRLVLGHGRFLAPADLAGLLAPTALAHRGRGWALIMALVTVLLFASGGLYKPRLHLSVLDQLPGLLRRSAAATTMVAVALLVLIGNQPVLQRFLVLAGAGMVLQLLARWAAFQVVLWFRARGVGQLDTVVLGGGVVARQLTSTLQKHPQYGLHPVGFLDDDPLVGPEALHLPQLGGVGDLTDLLDRRQVPVLIVAFTSAPETQLVDVLRAGERLGTEVFVVPRLFEVQAPGGAGDHIGAIPVFRCSRPRLGGPSWVAKRVLDLVVSAVALAVLSPLLALIAVGVRLDGGPGVLFRQQRIGRDGHVFELLKFRSMRPVDEREAQTTWTIAGDRRVSRLGRFLRRASLDELPQLLNVVRGEMSLVGPRPERPHFVRLFSVEHEHARYGHRHRVPCGLTGLSQVSGLRGDTSIADRARYDNFYIEHWSLWLDVKILLLTALEVVHGRGG